MSNQSVGNATDSAGGTSSSSTPITHAGLEPLLPNTQDDLHDLFVEDNTTMTSPKPVTNVGGFPKFSGKGPGAKAFLKKPDEEQTKAEEEGKALADAAADADAEGETDTEEGMTLNAQGHPVTGGKGPSNPAWVAWVRDSARQYAAENEGASDDEEDDGTAQDYLETSESEAAIKLPSGFQTACESFYIGPSGHPRLGEPAVAVHQTGKVMGGTLHLGPTGQPRLNLSRAIRSSDGDTPRQTRPSSDGNEHNERSTHLAEEYAMKPCGGEGDQHEENPDSDINEEEQTEFGSEGFTSEEQGDEQTESESEGSTSDEQEQEEEEEEEEEEVVEYDAVAMNDRARPSSKTDTESHKVSSPSPTPIKPRRKNKPQTSTLAIDKLLAPITLERKYNKATMEEFLRDQGVSRADYTGKKLKDLARMIRGLQLAHLGIEDPLESQQESTGTPAPKRKREGNMDDQSEPESRVKRSKAGGDGPTFSTPEAFSSGTTQKVSKDTKRKRASSAEDEKNCKTNAKKSRNDREIRQLPQKGKASSRGRSPPCNTTLSVNGTVEDGLNLNFQQMQARTALQAIKCVAENALYADLGLTDISVNVNEPATGSTTTFTSFAIPFLQSSEGGPLISYEAQLLVHEIVGITSSILENGGWQESSSEPKGKMLQKSYCDNCDELSRRVAVEFGLSHGEDEDEGVDVVYPLFAFSF